MRVSELLNAIAIQLESPENEALILSESNDKCLEAVAAGCCMAAQILRKTAEKVELLDLQEQSNLTSESIDDLGKFATALDQSGDEELQKTAALIDELLLTIAAPPNWFKNYKEAQEKKVNEMKAQYLDAHKELHEMNKVKESAQAIDKSPIFKEYRIMEHALSTRNCPDHAGVQLQRIGQDQWQCSLDHKIYDWANGFDLENNAHVPGGNVSEQTPKEMAHPEAMFSTRQDIMENFKH